MHGILPEDWQIQILVLLFKNIVKKPCTMSGKFIPIIPAPRVKNTASLPSNKIKIPLAVQGTLFDRRQRRLQDLRISVTDRCNFRCTYCMPKAVFHKDYVFQPQSDLLSFEEITRLAKIFVAQGVRKIRLTGGEPLLRKNIENLVQMLSQLRTPEGEQIDLSMTTNGALLARKAQALKAAGLSRLTVSLDALDDAVFKRMNDVDFPVADVLDGIAVAQAAGFAKIKINMVVKGGMNDQEIIPMAKYFKNSPHILRLIEYMDVGTSNAWELKEVVSTAEIIARLEQAGLALVALAANNDSETASRWQYTDGQGEIGFISSVSKAFCSDCSRARLSTQGKLYTCLFATEGHDLRALLRGLEMDEADNAIAMQVREIWQTRDDHYSEIRSAASNNGSNLEAGQRKKIEMSYIGG
ncbi:MAG: GTP 3',8-cyclase MoaA [Undibacterium sp.]|nr:GTP 3',8-cyclase MoaA [Undibacterium sp.]